MLRMSGLFVLLFSIPALGQPAGKYAEAIRSIETQVESERLNAGIPGVSIALVEDQTVIWTKGFGHMDLAKSKTATPDTVYRVGSVSKLFTDLAVMQLVDEGKIDIDGPVTQVSAGVQASEFIRETDHIAPTHVPSGGTRPRAAGRELL